MKTTINIDDKILEKASQLTGVKEKTALVRLGLEALIDRESSKRLAILEEPKKNYVPFQDESLPESRYADMVLFDTSVWVSHLREGDRELETLLMNDEILSYPIVFTLQVAH